MRILAIILFRPCVKLRFGRIFARHSAPRVALVLWRNAFAARWSRAMVRNMNDTEVLSALAAEIRAGKMTTKEALARAFVCGLNAAVHAQQDREARESGEWLASVGIVHDALECVPGY
jgi:hypothetical protein